MLSVFFMCARMKEKRRLSEKYYLPAAFICNAHTFLFSSDL